MRVTVSHNKPIPEVKQAADRSLDQIVKGVAGSPVEVADEHRTWNGNTMNFSLTAKMGPLRAPIKGLIEITEKDITIDADLGILDKLMGTEKVREAVAARVRGLLT